MNPEDMTPQQIVEYAREHMWEGVLSYDVAAWITANYHLHIEPADDSPVVAGLRRVRVFTN